MSKSLGNIILTKDLTSEYHGEVIRLALLSTHYRQGLDWNDSIIHQSKKLLDKLYKMYFDLSEIDATEDDNSFSIIDSLLDDLNTPLAIREMQRLVSSNDSDLEENISTFKYIFEGSDQDLSIDKKLSNEIEKLIEERNNARNNNDYEKADKIRDKLSEMNVKINDVNGKTEWEIL